MYRYVVIAVLLILLPHAAPCAADDLYWNFNGSRFFGTSSSASDNYDASDLLGSGTGSIHVGVYHEQGTDGWMGPTGFYRSDFRAPLGAAPGATKTWRIYLWADSTLPSDRETIGLYWYGTEGVWSALSGVEFRLTYVRPATGVTGDTYPVGSYLTMNDHPDGTGWGPVPAIRTDNGLDGYVFDLTATVIPEPPALLALSAGLTGLTGLALGRRR